MKAYNKIWKIATGQEDDYTTGCLLDYDYFKEPHKMMATDLNKQQTRDAEPKALQQISLSENVENQSTIFFIIEEAKETVLDFSQGTVKLLLFYFVLIQNDSI